MLHQGVRDLLARGGDELGRFDLIYSAGLYDYLSEPIARRLTQRLLGMLRSKGRLLIANFLPGGSGRGYQELFMDWPLIVRDAAELQALALGGSVSGGGKPIVRAPKSSARPVVPRMPTPV